MNFEYYSVEQIAKLLHLHPKTVQRYIREGKIRAAKVGKSWRVHGHELSVFAEGMSRDERESERAGFETLSREKTVRISSVIDIDVDSRQEAIRIANSLTAALNAKPAEYGQTTMSVQIIEPENKVRVMLWGGIGFMNIMLQSIAALTNEEGSCQSFFNDGE